MIPDDALTAAATAAIEDAFGATPVFACLTGSTAAGCSAPDSDIDLLVVLPNDLPQGRAVLQRERFTRNYIQLHTDFGRTPDLQWPAEVCYAADLDAAIDGGAFDPASGPILRLCPTDQPHRYWTSMTASGIPIAGNAAFADYSRRCAATLIAHIQFNQHLATTTTHEPASTADAPEWAEWAIPPALRANVAHRANQTPNHNSDHITWRKQLRTPTSQPQLDQWISRWREIAAEANSTVTARTARAAARTSWRL